MRIATLNVLYHPHSRLRERLPLIRAGLRDLAPDVMALQEVDRTLDVDRAIAGSDYRVERAVLDPPDRFPRHWDGCSLLVAPMAGRIERHDVLRLSHHRVVQRIVLRRPDGRRVAVANTHLHHPLDPGGRRTREGQAEAIARWLDELPAALPVVLVGDLNGPPDEPYQDVLRAAGLVSAHAAVHGREPARTFPSGLVAPACTATEPETIDYVLVRGARATSCEVAFAEPAPDDPTLYPSDHLGLVCAIELPGAA